MRKQHPVIFKIILCLLLVAAVVIGVTVSTQQDKGVQTAPDSVQSTASPEPSAQGSEEAAPPDASAETAAPSAEPVTMPAVTPTPNVQPAAETCTISISCAAALQSDRLPDAVRAVLPENGQILGPVTIELEPGDTVWTVLQRVTRSHGVALEAQWTPAYGTDYVQGIGQLYEFDCGQGSGWIYSVNGAFPSEGCSSYPLQPGDVIRWLYTCDCGHAIGG